MDTIQADAIEDIAPFIQEYFVPAIEESAEVCVRSYWDDPYNDNWTFATQLWKNIWNRIYEIASSENSPVHLYGKGNEYRFRIGSVVLHHHRIDSSTSLPRAARAAKSFADTMQQLRLFDMEFDGYDEQDNIILAIDANPEDGLREIFIGELERESLVHKKYQWAKKIPIFKAKTSEIFDEPAVVPPDALPFQPDEKAPEHVVFEDEERMKKAARSGEK